MENDLLSQEYANNLAFNIKRNDEFWLHGHYYDGTAEWAKYRSQMRKKVDNEVKDCSCTEEEVVNEIMRSKLYRNHFALSPGKQKSHEKTQFAVVSDIVKKLNQEFKEKHHIIFSLDNNELVNKYYIKSDGSIASRRGRTSDIYEESKLFDYEFTIAHKGNIYRWFLINKYTKENGGAQNNTYREIGDTYKYCLKNTSKNIYFVFFLDGDYWYNKNEIQTSGNIIRTNHKHFEKEVINFLKTKNII